MTRTRYRLAMFALTALGLGLSADAAIRDSLNRYYFRVHHAEDTILLVLGIFAAAAFAFEGIFLVVYRRLDRTL